MIRRPLTDYFLYRALLVCAVIIITMVLIDRGPSAQQEADDIAAETARIEKQAQDEYLVRAENRAKLKAESKQP